MDEPTDPLARHIETLHALSGPGDEGSLREYLRSSTAELEDYTAELLVRVEVNAALPWKPEPPPCADGAAPPGTLRAHLDGQRKAIRRAGQAAAARGDIDQVVEASLAEKAAERRRRAVLERRRPA